MKKLLLALTFTALASVPLVHADKASEQDPSGKSHGKKPNIVFIPARFSKIEVEVSAQYQDRGLMEKLLIIAERGCIIANTLKYEVELSVSLSSTPE